MMTGCPRSSVSFTLSARAITSVLPPAGNGTTMRMGRAGYACAHAGTAAHKPAHSAKPQDQNLIGNRLTMNAESERRASRNLPGVRLRTRHL